MTEKLWKKFQTLEKKFREETGDEIFLRRCKRCGDLIDIGEMVITKPSKYRGRKLYHESCYNNMFI